MVEIKDIVDRESLEAWLNGQPKKFSQILTHRSAMRALPDFWYWALTSIRAQKEKTTVFPILRASLIAEVLSYSDSVDIKPELENMVSEAARLAARCADVAKSHTDVFSYEDAFSLKDAFLIDEGKAAASAFAANSALTVKPMMTSFAADSDLVYNGFWSLIRADISFFQVDGVSIRKGLWQRELNPFSERWSKIRRFCDNASVDWSFWIKWYEAALNGEPLNYKLLEQIALIPTADWEKGSAHVNAIISKIVMEFELKAKISELEGKLLQISSSGRGIGDNQGPPMVDEPVAKELMVIWEPLQELKDEIEEKHPNQKRLLEIAKKLGSMGAAIFKWGVKKADIAINTAIGIAVVKLSTEADLIARILAKLSELVEAFAGFF